MSNNTDTPQRSKSTISDSSDYEDDGFCVVDPETSDVTHNNITPTNRNLMAEFLGSENPIANSSHSGASLNVARKRPHTPLASHTLYAPMAHHPISPAFAQPSQKYHNKINSPRQSRQLQQPPMWNQVCYDPLSPFQDPSHAPHQRGIPTTPQKVAPPYFQSPFQDPSHAPHQSGIPTTPQKVAPSYFQSPPHFHSPYQHSPY
ncbi:hypothetical protein BGZ76_007286, partial [Entomortierella beljakovae]